MKERFYGHQKREIGLINATRNNLRNKQKAAILMKKIEQTEIPRNESHDVTLLIQS